jgi:hypothetical protein
MTFSKRTVAMAVEVVLAVLLFGPAAVFVAVPALWISNRFGRRGIHFVLGTTIVLLLAAAIVSTMTSTRLDAVYADRRALGENLGGLAAALVLISIAEFARTERTLARPVDGRSIRVLNPYNEEP